MAKRPPLSLDRLEDRRVPATFGVPWRDSNVSVSFAPDPTPIAAGESRLFQTLDAQLPRSVWQRDALRALQTWAVHTNLDVRFVADGGQAFGTAGFSQGDPRFGDVRVGAHAMSPSVLAVATPPGSAVSGTWAGDVLINSTADLDGSPHKLFPVLLHEMGNALGVGNSTDPASPMYAGFNNQVATLTQGDIETIQALYGRRAPDAFEGPAGNGSLAMAADLPEQTNYLGLTQLLAFGDITQAGDVDVFRVEMDDDDSGQVTVRLQTAGVSLLAPRVTVYDESGLVVTGAAATNPKGSTLNVTFTPDDDDEEFFVRVEGNAGNAFGVGGYGLAVDFENLSVTTPGDVNRVLRGPYEGLSPDTLAALLFDRDALIAEDFGADDLPADAAELATAAGFEENTQYAAPGSIEALEDADHFRFRSPAPGGPDVLTVTAFAPAGGLSPQLALFDGAGVPLPAKVLVADDGTATLELAGAAADADFVVRVTDAPHGDGWGNYFLTADFGTVPAPVEDFASGTLGEAVSAAEDRVYVARSHMFHFILAADAAGAPPAALVRMTVTDAAGGVAFAAEARPGEALTGGVFLKPGAFTVRFEAVGAAGQTLGYTLRGTRVTDPTGPALHDPTLEPTYIDPLDPTRYVYPGGVLSDVPFLWVPVLL